MHRANKTERAIRTWKSHIITMLCSTDINFPLDAWDLLHPHASPSFSPHTSAWHSLHGPYDFDHMPIAPPPLGCVLSALKPLVPVRLGALMVSMASTVAPPSATIGVLRSTFPALAPPASQVNSLDIHHQATPCLMHRLTLMSSNVSIASVLHLTSFVITIPTSTDNLNLSLGPNPHSPMT